MTKRDKAVMQLAIDTLLADDSNPGRQKQVRDKLAHPRLWGPWEETGSFCSFVCQVQSLGLRPWQKPPCHGDPDGDEPHDILLRRMLEAGVGRYHPDPAQALETAKSSST